MILLQVEDLSFKYPEQQNHLLKGLNFSLEKGQILAVSGNNGSGKTTLLNILSGIIPRHRPGEIEGKIGLAGIDHKEASLPQLSTVISLVMQQPEDQIFFPIVEQELAFAPENLCITVKEIEERIGNVLEILGISQLRNIETAKLSYGQQKLVALASVHTLQPEIMLLDEISNGLDRDKTEAVIRLIREYVESGKAVIIADHHTALIELADINLNLNRND